MKRFVSVILLLAAAAGLWLAGRLNSPLVELRRKYRLDQADPLQNSPPLVAFTTVALGGFRGVLADLLWIRASKLQEQGKYFELVQLADWITKLEPRFTQVWAFHAWNMAYNISVLFNDPEDRWRWVRHGISLLRDEGLKYNAGDAQLCRELGWLFQHKIGGYYDQAHRYYKEQWAREMMALFDGPRPDYDALMAAPTNSPEYATARKLIDVYQLDPRLMKQEDDEYGPLDWRLPQAHAIYWALQAKRYASGFEAIAADRMIFQSLAQAFREGRLFLDSAENAFIPSPNLDILPRVLKAFNQALAEFPDQDSIKAAHQHFLEEAIIILYTYHRIDEAKALFDVLARRYPSAETAVGFDAAITKAFGSAVKNLTARDALAMVEGTEYQSLFWHALGDEGRAKGYHQLGRVYWQQYMAPRMEKSVREREGLPPIEDIRARARTRLLEELKSPEARKRLEQAPKP
ncbi:MAG: hypothetical protein V1873_08400 [Verrucomicrobiota bacterium]